MSKENPKILVLSSVDPHRGPAVVAEDQYKRFKKAGYDVDFMEYDPSEDTYTLQVFWDKIAVTGQGVRRQLETVEEDLDDYDE